MQEYFQQWIDSNNIPNVGSCESQGRIDYAPEATDADRERGAELVAQWQAMTDAGREAASEQARLQAVAVRLAVPLAAFAATWQATGIETVPDSWLHALDLLAGQPPEVHIKLLALRFGPLAADWDDVLAILNSPQ